MRASRTFPTQAVPRAACILLSVIAVLLVAAVPAGATVVYTRLASFGGGETPPGAFTEQLGLALDNDSSSPSSGEVYATDMNDSIVSKFTFPTSTTAKFVCVLNGTFKGQPTTPCANNATVFTATATSGSTTLTGVSSFSGSVSLNSVIAGAGIPTGTTIVSVSAGAKELVMSAAATASGAGVSLTANPGFTKATGVAVNGSGDVWAANEKASPVVDEYSPSGVFMGAAITESLLTGQTPATFSALRGVAAGPNGEVYVDDSGNKVVDKFVETSPSSGVYQFSCHLNATGTNSSLCGGAGTTTTTAFGTMTHSNDLAVDPSGNVYVISGSSVDKFNSAGGFVASINIGVTELGFPREGASVAVNPATSNLYIGFPHEGFSSSTFVREYCEEAGCATPGSLLNELTVPNQIGNMGLAVNSAPLHTRVYAGSTAVSVFEAQIKPSATTEACPSPGRKTTELELKGMVNPEGLAATSLFEYGETVLYGAPIVSSPSSDGSGNSPVTVTAKATGLKPHTVYHYRVHASNSELSANGSDVSCETLIAPPAVNDAPVSAISITNSASAPATTFLSGTLNPEHDPTTYHFVYGTTSAFGQSTPAVYAGSTYGDEVVPQTIEGLQPDTEYHYALVANNEAGMESIGNEGTFVTKPEAIPPVVHTGAPEGVSSEAATLTGTVVAQGLPTSYDIEFGTDTGYGAKVFGQVGSGRTEAPVAVLFPALSPGTTYHYRLVAINTGGTTYGADETFTTPTGPSFVLTQPPTPVLVATPTFPEVKEPPLKKATTTPKAVTRAQKLAKALKACKQQPKSKRAGCEKQARKKYAPATKKKKR